MAVAWAQGTSVVYEHDARGRLVKATYTDGTIVNYSYDENGNRTGADVVLAPPDEVPPTAPGTPTFTSITATSAVANWLAASDDTGVVGYDLRLNSGDWQAKGKALSASLTDLSEATTYTFQVRARDAAGNVSGASSAAFTTLDVTAPSVPTGLTVTAPASNTVNIGWAASSDNVGVAGYRVIRDGGVIAAVGSTSYTDNAVSGGASYSYRISAYDGAGNTSAPSTAVNVTPPDTIVPSAPSGLSASATGPNRVVLTWNGSSDTGGSGLAGYRIYRGGAHIANSSSSPHTDTSASPGTAYSYTVAAYDNAGNVSAHSNTASATTPLPVQVSVNKTSWSWFYRLGQPTPNPTPVVVTASGGLGGYSYTWQRVSGDTQMTALSPSSNSTGWYRDVPEWNVSYNSVWRCLVTDGAGNTGYSADISVTFRKTDLQ